MNAKGLLFVFQPHYYSLMLRFVSHKASMSEIRCSMKLENDTRFSQEQWWSLIQINFSIFDYLARIYRRQTSQRKSYRRRWCQWRCTCCGSLTICLS